MPFVEFALNNSVHASTGETPFYINGLRQPRTLVSFVRSPSLSGEGPLTTLGATTKEGQSCPSDPASLAAATIPIGFSAMSRQVMPVLLDGNAISLSTASTHDRPLGGVIGELDAKSVSEAQRFVDERLAITRKSVTRWQAHRTSKKNMRTNMVAKTMNTLVWGIKYY